MVQRLFQYLTQHMNPLIRCTLHHTKLKSENFLKRIHFYIIQDEEKLVFKSDQGQLCSASTILAFAIVSVNIILLDILIPSALEMWEQLIKFSLSQTRHGKQKLRMFFDLMVGKHYPLPLEEENGSLHRVLNKRITLRGREFHDFLIYLIIRDNV